MLRVLVRAIQKEGLSFVGIEANGGDKAVELLLDCSRLHLWGMQHTAIVIQLDSGLIVILKYLFELTE